jgi:hypothetical protein
MYSERVGMKPYKKRGKTTPAHSKLGEIPGHPLNAPCNSHAFVSVFVRSTRPLSSASAGRRLNDLGHLRASTHDAVA